MAKANSSELTLIPAVAYFRMSSDQQEASIPDQRKAVEKYAEQHGYKIIREYADEGIAGWRNDRELFQRLIDDLPKGDFRAVLCWDQNRFSRFPVLEANHYWYLLDRAGVHLATVRQGRIDWHSIAGWLTASIKQHADAEYKKELSDNVKRAKGEIAKRGEWQGMPPFGYAVENRRLVLGDPAKVEVVRRIFREYIDGYTLNRIAHALNSEGIRSTRGQWAPTSIQQLLRNPAYLGIFQYGGVEIRDNHPAIVDPETVERVSQLLAERQKKTTPTKTREMRVDFVLTGLLKCGRCGSAMLGAHLERKNPFYQCAGRLQKGQQFCELNSCKQSELLGYVIDAIEQRYTPKVIARLRAELHKQVAATKRKANPDRIAKQLDALAGKLAKAKRRLVEVDADMLADVQEGIRTLRQEQERLEAALKAAQMPQDGLTADADRKLNESLNVITRLRTTFQKGDNLLLRELLREAVDHVLVWSERTMLGRRHVYKLQRGKIAIRDNNLSYPTISI